MGRARPWNQPFKFKISLRKLSVSICNIHSNAQTQQSDVGHPLYIKDSPLFINYFNIAMSSHFFSFYVALNHNIILNPIQTEQLNFVNRHSCQLGIQQQRGETWDKWMLRIKIKVYIFTVALVILSLDVKKKNKAGFWNNYLSWSTTNNLKH